MKSLLKSLVFSRYSMKNSENKDFIQENLQDSPGSGLNEMMVKKENSCRIRGLLRNLPCYDISEYGEKIKYSFQRDLTEEEKAFACLYFEERNLNGYGFRKNTRI